MGHTGPPQFCGIENLHDQNSPPIAESRLGWAGSGILEIGKSALRWLKTIKANTPNIPPIHPQAGGLGQLGMMLGSTPSALKPVPLHYQRRKI